jgi:uncharacterized membrane protein YeaQ/YmgE (transglycosylase-associated protein family)
LNYSIVLEKKGKKIIMNILLWIVFGAIAGWLASVIMKTDAQQGLLGDILLGIIGAVVGGFVVNLLGEPGVTGFNLYSIVVSIIGAVLVIFAGRSLARG